MKHVWVGAVAVSLIAACSDGNPFVDSTTDPGTGTTGTVPTTIQSDLGEFTYDPVSQTLTITGLTLEAEPLTATYNRRPGLDRVGYEAYTTQESPLDRHSTAYVKDINGTRAVVVVTGGQFGSYFGGATYTRSGAYDPPTTGPTTGLASYAGNYVGLLNGGGSSEDLLTPDPTVPASLLPSQAAEITGVILINADFGDNQVNGRITSRAIPDNGGITPEDIDLAPTAINDDGTFSGNVEQANQTRGNYGGIFGGTDAGAVAGGLFVSNHISQLTDEEEYGIFVLVQCGQPGADPLCD